MSVDTITKRIPVGERNPKLHGQHKTIEDCLQCSVCRPQARQVARELLKEKAIDEKTCIELENETDSRGVGYTLGNRAERRKWRKR